jgi:putative heme-binding domain-containing protein
LLYRISKFGKDRMPHIGSELPDPQGIALISEWIASKGENKPITPTPGSTEAAMRTAIEWAKSPSLSSAQISTIANMATGPGKELFDGYLPHTGERKLGPNPRARAILSLEGDIERGRELFANTRNQCMNCHQIDGKGIAVGPDLSKIAKDNKREQILESILEPSRRIDPKYQSYTLNLEDGRGITGILIKKDQTGGIIRDAQGKDVSFKNEDVSSIKASSSSLMATGLLSDFTPQQAADLLAFLASKK